jgi:probable H4MPT-linked C1 transfer pathway protein
MPERLVTGLDLGGAHLKAAQVTEAGRVVRAVQVPCALWQGLDRLERALEAVTAELRPTDLAALTMTGELADLFPDRASGVARLLDVAERHFADLRVLAGRSGLVAAAEARARASEVASANWLATALLAADRLPEGIVVDLGSTTTDILPFAGGRVLTEGSTDRERLALGELVYQGLTRTPVMAIADTAPMGGRQVPLMNELFATAADVYRLLGRLDEAMDQHPAADGGAKTGEGSARRLARMVGADLAEAPPAAWRRVAAWLAEAQLRRIADRLALVLSRGLVGDTGPLVGAGCGRHLVQDLACRCGRPYVEFTSLVDADPAAAGWVATCAPAVATALLGARLLRESPSAARTAAKRAGSRAPLRSPRQRAPRKPR